MTEQGFSHDELRAALATADRQMRLPWASMVVGIAITGIATSIALRVADFSDPTHVLIAAAVAWLFGWIFFGLSLLQSRQLAANARMLRALELMDERLGREPRG